jgi:hypothetical protein
VFSFLFFADFPGDMEIERCGQRRVPRVLCLDPAEQAIFLTEARNCHGSDAHERPYFVLHITSNAKITHIPTKCLSGFSSYAWAWPEFPDLKL